MTLHINYENREDALVLLWYLHNGDQPTDAGVAELPPAASMENAVKAVSSFSLMKGSQVEGGLETKSQEGLKIEPARFEEWAETVRSAKEQRAKDATCPRCGGEGKGRFGSVVGVCFLCKGEGVVTQKQRKMGLESGSKYY